METRAHLLHPDVGVGPQARLAHYREAGLLLVGLSRRHGARLLGFEHAALRRRAFRATEVFGNVSQAYDRIVKAVLKLQSACCEALWGRVALRGSSCSLLHSGKALESKD
jgi:hypothetical protein